MNLIRRIIGIVACLLLLTPAMRPWQAAALGTATLFFSPATVSITNGQSTSVSFYVRSTTEYINAAEATINFPRTILNVSSVSTSGSIFTLWAQGPSFSNSTGKVTFSGGRPSPGFKGSSGKILTINFVARATGSARLTVSGAQVLRNDANGTNILSGTGTATITVAAAPSPPPPPPPPNSAPSISSPSSPDPAKWYPVRDLSAAWAGGSGVQGYSTVFDQKSNTIPPETSQGLTSSFSRKDVADGEWYLHVRAKYASGWSGTSHFRFGVDATQPEPFTITIEGDPLASFSANDATSGIDHYEVAIDSDDFSAAESPYQTPELPVGKHTLKVRAYDKAGNFRESSVDFEISNYPQPVIFDLTPVVFGNQPVIIRGYANAQDTLRLTIDDNTYGPYPVSEYVDPSPPRTPPEGKVAWKIQVNANVAAGQHDITLTALGPDGQVSPETSPVHFRIVTGVLKIFGIIIPTVLVINLLLILFVLALAFGIFYFIKYRRLRHSAGGVVRSKWQSGSSSGGSGYASSFHGDRE